MAASDGVAALAESPHPTGIARDRQNRSLRNRQEAAEHWKLRLERAVSDLVSAESFDTGLAVRYNANTSDRLLMMQSTRDPSVGR